MQSSQSKSLIQRWNDDKNSFRVLNQQEKTSKSFSELLENIEKFNPYHDSLGRFTSGGSATSFTYAPGKSKAHDLAIAREKERMAATGGGSESPKAQTEGRGHITPKSHKERLEIVKSELNCDDKQAKKYAKSIYSFTSENYEAIRAYQTGVKNDYTKKFSRDSKSIEDYIDKAPKWNGGTLYRGIVLENGDAKTIFKPGTELDMKGTSSWSSDKNVAESFTFGSGNKVVFQCDRISKSTSVTHLSDNPSEKEVLASKDTKYIAKKVSKKGNIYYVYVDEVTGMAKSFSEVTKFNPYHDSKGRFTSSGSAASFTYKPGASTAHDNAISREKARVGSDADTGKGFKGTLYHGSPNTDIKEFDMSRAGLNTSSGEKLIFFTDSKQMADDFSYERLEGSSKFFQRRGKKGRVYEVDVEMKNPLDLRKLSDTDIDNIIKLDTDGILTRETVKSMMGNHQLLKTSLDLRADSLKKLGYDGFIANTGKAGHNSLEYAVVDSKQAKIRKSDYMMAKSFSDIMKYNDKHDELGRFAPKNGGAASGGFTPAKTIEEAQEFAYKQLKINYADYSNCGNDMKTVNMINKQIYDIYEKYPELKGSVSEITSHPTKEGTLFSASSEGISGMPSLNIGSEIKKGYDEIQKKYEEDVEYGFHPKGTTIESAIWHEFGHFYEYDHTDTFEGIRNRESSQKWLDEARGNTPERVFQNQISVYATKNSSETFAEAFAEFNTSRTCRPEAVALMKASGVYKPEPLSQQELDDLAFLQSLMS